MCYILEKFGYQTAFVDTQGYDVIVNYKKRPISKNLWSAGLATYGLYVSFYQYIFYYELEKLYKSDSASKEPKKDL